MTFKLWVCTTSQMKTGLNLLETMELLNRGNFSYFSKGCLLLSSGSSHHEDGWASINALPAII